MNEFSNISEKKDTGITKKKKSIKKRIKKKLTNIEETANIKDEIKILKKK